MSKLLDWLHRYEAYTPLFLRLGLGAVFFWFGIDKLIHPLLWLGFIPEWVKPFILIPMGIFTTIQAFVEIIIGLMLVFGLWQQIAAGIGGLILIPIIVATFSLGVYDIALRDIGLLAIALSLAVTPETIISIDAWRNAWKHSKHASIHQ